MKVHVRNPGGVHRMVSVPVACRLIRQGWEVIWPVNTPIRHGATNPQEGWRG